MITSADYLRPDQWQVQIQAMVQLKARVLIKAGCLSDDQIRKAHFEPIGDVADTVDQALAAAGAEASLCVLPNGPQTIPYLG